jgi:hypothetical protein
VTDFLCIPLLEQLELDRTALLGRELAHACGERAGKLDVGVLWSDRLAPVLKFVECRQACAARPLSSPAGLASKNSEQEGSNLGPALEAGNDAKKRCPYGLHYVLGVAPGEAESSRASQQRAVVQAVFLAERGAIALPKRIQPCVL